MTDPHFTCEILRAKLLSLHRSGVRWNQISDYTKIYTDDKRGVSAGAISNFATGTGGLESRSYNALLDALSLEFGAFVPKLGTVEHRLATLPRTFPAPIPMSDDAKQALDDSVAQRLQPSPTPVAASQSSETTWRATITLDGTYFSYDGFQLVFADESGNVHNVQLPQGTPVSIEAAD